MISEENLIFIVSQPRSGSTLLQKLISNNPSVSTSSEPWLLLLFSNFYRQDLIRAKYNEKVAYVAFEDYLRKFSHKQLFDKQIKTLLLSLYDASLGNKRYFLDKTPRYYEITSQLIEWFPNSKILVLKRNPFAVLNSMIQTWGKGKISLKNLLTFERDFLEAPRLIQSFLDMHGNSDNVNEVKYEDIVENPEDYVKKIYSWLNLPYSSSVLNFGKNEKTKGIFGDDVYKVQRDISYNFFPNDKSINTWEGQMGNKSFRDFILGYANFLGAEFLSNYGYNTLDESYPTKSTAVFKKLLLLRKNPEMLNFKLKNYIKYRFL